jgi:hypothetical protein
MTANPAIRPPKMGHIGRGFIPDAAADPGVAAALFVDYSNIVRGLHRAAEIRWERATARLDFRQLRRLLAAGRTASRALIVADAETPGGARRAMVEAGFEVIERERGRLSGTEQANDETLQVRIYETLSGIEQGVLVLATGDGAGSAHGRGFIPALGMARAHGWALELASWDDSTNGALRRFVLEHAGQTIALDDYYYGISEAPPLRWASTIPLRHRPTADGAVSRATLPCYGGPMGAARPGGRRCA